MRAAIREVLLDAAGLLLPTACAGCGSVGRSICDHCRCALAPDVLSRALPDGTRVWSGLAYEGVARRVILALKEQGRTGLAVSLAPALAGAARAAEELGTAVRCPIPSSGAARRRRGYDPLALVLRRTGIASVGLLRPGRSPEEQKRLSRSERAANAGGAFRAHHVDPGLPVVLVDDVVTTGSTLVEAARVLRAVGVEVIGAIAIASTPLRHGRPSRVSENRP